MVQSIGGSGVSIVWLGTMSKLEVESSSSLRLDPANEDADLGILDTMTASYLPVRAGFEVLIAAPQHPNRHSATGLQVASAAALISIPINPDG